MSGGQLRFAATIPVIALATLALGAPLVASGARQATPAAAEYVSCDVEPRTVEGVLALASPPSTEGRPILPLPEGVSADPATLAEVEHAVRLLDACASSADVLRFTALFSDGWITRTVQRDETLEAELAERAATTPTPIPEIARPVIVGPWHVETLDDGRVLAAVVWFRAPFPEVPDADRVKVLVFVHEDGRWLIDETIDRVTVEACDLPVDVVAIVGPPPGVMGTVAPMPCTHAEARATEQANKREHAADREAKQKRIERRATRKAATPVPVE